MKKQQPKPESLTASELVRELLNIEEAPPGAVTVAELHAASPPGISRDTIERKMSSEIKFGRWRLAGRKRGPSGHWANAYIQNRK